MNQTKLRPCPFCGSSELNVSFTIYASTIGGRAFVECLNCGAKSGGEVVKNTAETRDTVDRFVQGIGESWNGTKERTT